MNPRLPGGLHRLIVFFMLACLLTMPGTQALDNAVDQGQVRPLWDAQWRDANQTIHHGITGAGVVAMQHEGYDATHPDLTDCSDFDRNVLNSGPGPYSESGIPFPADVSTVGHGTLVTGMFCGSGAMSDGKLKGVAHGATMFATNKMLGLSPPDLSNWYTEHNLRIFTDSTGGDIREKMERSSFPADADLVLVDSVGNDGGDGSESTVNPHINSDPRIVGVAGSTADRSTVANGSSKGAKGDPSTWPTITASFCAYTTGQAQSQTIGAITWSTYSVVDDPTCRPAEPEEHLRRTAGLYALVSGTSFAAPFTAGVFALVFEVNPHLNATDSIYLVTRTADAFLETPGFDHPWQQTNETFFLEHGWQAGWGHVNATRAVAAAHYLLLDPEASKEEALHCWTTGRTEDGRLELNPEGTGPCRWLEENYRDPDVRADSETANPSDPGPFNMDVGEAPFPAAPLVLVLALGILIVQNRANRTRKE